MNSDKLVNHEAQLIGGWVSSQSTLEWICEEKGVSSRLLTMCGICGVFDFSGASVDRALVGKMTNLLAHRGPDEPVNTCRNALDLGIGV